MFCSRSFNRFSAIRSSWCIREAHRCWHRRKSALKMNELENEKVNMIYAETQRGESSLRWWGAPLESISAERRSAGWYAIRLHHSSSLYCLPICEWQESRRHLYAYNLSCHMKPWRMKQESRKSACLGVFISLTVEGIFLSAGGTGERLSEHTTDFQRLSASNLLCAIKVCQQAPKRIWTCLSYLNSDICIP